MVRNGQKHRHRIVVIKNIGIASLSKIDHRWSLVSSLTRVASVRVSICWLTHSLTHWRTSFLERLVTLKREKPINVSLTHTHTTCWNPPKLIMYNLPVHFYWTESNQILRFPFLCKMQQPALLQLDRKNWDQQKWDLLAFASCRLYASCVSCVSCVGWEFDDDGDENDDEIWWWIWLDFASQIFWKTQILNNSIYK